MKITFHGAARTVTGSKHLLITDKGTQILLDCGLFQGEGKNTPPLNSHWGFDPREIDYVLLSHAHIDHSGLLPKILAYAGAISVERTWRSKGKDVTEKRDVNPNDTENIRIALEDGWVITFPQGTTKSFKPVRKGTAHIIKQHRPIVVPIVIDGFRRSFDKKGLRMKKKGILQSFIIKEPLNIDYENDSIDEIVEKVEYAIEQHPSFLKVIPAEELEEEERLNVLRNWDI